MTDHNTVSDHSTATQHSTATDRSTVPGHDTAVRPAATPSWSPGPPAPPAAASCPGFSLWDTPSGPPAPS
ncbi:hypothetical protein GTW98_30070 [Streptomyces sp. SID8375]|uniref:hypothetical protein n=1 Tax=unclassified Streptomyces TaxID=2593676 RepID=UPI00037F6121|nr:MULTISPECIES: hypothetical protein [unclassified Streptomyces]MYX10993.1 hypothetical protein [Streptomyces sp. SID8375]